MKNRITKVMSSNGFIVSPDDRSINQLYQLVRKVAEKAYDAGYSNGNLDTCLCFSEYWDRYGKEQQP